MGCDIHSLVEVFDPDKGRWLEVGDVFPADEFNRKLYKKDKLSEPFQYRSYGLFGFLADVRNYSRCQPLSQPKGLPPDWKDGHKEEWEDRHSHSWFLLKELLEFDYDKTFWDRRVSKEGSGAALANEGEGRIISYQDFLGKPYFDILDVMKTIGPPEFVRVVFCFDS